MIHFSFNAGLICHLECSFTCYVLLSLVKGQCYKVKIYGAELSYRALTVIGAEPVTFAR